MKRVSKNNPCPICNHGDWCYLNDTGDLAFCMRVPSKMKAKSDAWIHFLKARDSAVPVRRAPLPVPVRKHVFDAARAHESMRNAWCNEMLDFNAVNLNVNMDALERLQPGWDSFSKAVAYPMRDARGAIIGIRLRNREGKKWAVAGSRDGLFYDPGMILGEDGDLAVCEGPTDTAAAYTLGLNAVGRSSCQTGCEMLKALASRLRAKLITIIADADGWKERPDGSKWRPGIEGAIALGNQLGRIHRVVVPPRKDLREWVGHGCTMKEWLNWVSTSQRRLPT